MDQITPEQQKQLNKLGAKLLAKSFWTGIHHALMAVVMNTILLFGVLTFLGDNQPALMVGCILIGFFTFRRMHSVVKQDTIKFQEEAKKIIKN